MNLLSAITDLGIRYLLGIAGSIVLAFAAFAVQGVPNDPLLLRGSIELLLSSVFVAQPIIHPSLPDVPPKVTLLWANPVIAPYSLTLQRLLPIIS